MSRYHRSTICSGPYYRLHNAIEQHKRKHIEKPANKQSEHARHLLFIHLMDKDFVLSLMILHFLPYWQNWIQQHKKPQPISFKRIWWPAIRLGFGMTKGSPGYAVYFHDKNGNRIGWKRMDSADEDSSNWSKWDLSKAVEEPSDFSQMEQEI
jgi:hypothetical protein